MTSTQKPRKKRKGRIGRPYSGGSNPCRDIGRWTNADWNKIRAAAKKADKTIAAWAREILLAAAENQS